ncbi:TetR/AcrR family transcriptional regulator [Amycolatopsis minnesotensis]|uniref:TetR/AcrR family transcriptional regulator n=1 Tax=Amycolatopsis minnesotensis TaxID=337894 RepID=A0ABP5EAL6_9PSEU
MPKIIGGSLTAHREQVRAKVFDALRAQLYERGFDAVTLAGVASAAGVGRTAIYNHFPDRESLLIAFVEAESARYVERLEEAVAAAGDPVSQLAAFVRMQLRTLAEYHLPPGGTLASALAPSAYQRIAAHADPIGERLRVIIADGIRAGQLPEEDPDTLAGMISSAIGGRQVVDVPADRLDAVIDTAVRFVLRGAGVKTAPNRQGI